MQDDPYQRLIELLALRAQSDQELEDAARNNDQLDELIAAECERIAALGMQERPTTAREKARRRWGTGGIAVIATGAGMLRRAASDNPAITAALAGGAAVATGAGLVLAVNTGNTPGEATAWPTPSVSAPAQPPDQPPSRPSRPRQSQPEQPPEAIALPIQPAPGVDPVMRVDGPPKVPAPAQLPPGDHDSASPVHVGPSPTCLADVRVLALDVRLLCGG